MFENIGTALIQLLGFLGVFIFFVYQLFSDNNKDKTFTKNLKVNQNNSPNKNNSKRKRLFGRESNPSEENTKIKKGWFN